jgi:hypothetical protein
VVSTEEQFTEFQNHTHICARTTRIASVGGRQIGSGRRAHTSCNHLWSRKPTKTGSSSLTA